MLRPSFALEASDDQQRAARVTARPLPQHVCSLGASLRYPLEPEMLHAIKMEPFVLQAAVPAAKLFMDSTSGRSIHLRCC